MAELNINIGKITDNIRKIGNFLASRNVQWSLITKVFSGEISLLEKILREDLLKNIHSVGDSRLSSLKNLKQVNPDVKTIYIKPPAAAYAEDVVKFADISLNSSYRTISKLNDIAKKMNKRHSIIIMIELGELREGVMRHDLMEFYNKVFQLDNIEVVGLGTNLGCMYGVEPTYDKLLQLVLYKQLIECRFNKELNLISGGSSITLPMVDTGMFPKEVNHLRIGEAAFFGTSPLNNELFQDLNGDAFAYFANIIELEEKNIVPDGVISDGNVGHAVDIDDLERGKTSYKAILDFGLLDVDKDSLMPVNSDVKYVGITSDMTVVDIGNNRDSEGKTKYHVGGKMAFKPDYMGVARLLNSRFTEKIIVS
ncbi:MAG: amino-acid racemase [Bacteroidetes bacterium HGW-Bacteroidetes-6]|jgi:predicted amino acid racemase|nr:MAG: amino-acid racemase [Bacteroidetes bacterium HGW-Bacteroidetes-6]